MRSLCVEYDSQGFSTTKEEFMKIDKGSTYRVWAKSREVDENILKTIAL